MAQPREVVGRELRLALLSELGAHAIYTDLARLTRDPELRSVLARLAQEEDEQIRTLRDLMTALGLRPPGRSRRRRLLAGLLAIASPLLGRRLVLRVCMAAEDKAARWYAQFQQWFLQAGPREHASVCGRLSETKRRHAQVLDAWVSNL